MANNLSTINNQFEFNFPLTFVPESVEKRYLGYLKAKRKMHSSVLDFLNSTILNLSFPSITFNTVNNPQIKHRKNISWKAVDNINDLFEKTITVTVRDVDAHINYFILLDCLSYKYLDTDTTYDENVIVTIVNENRNALYQIQFRDVIWLGMSDISLAYNVVDMGTDTFTLQFTYNYIDIVWVAEDTDIIQSAINNK